jgi:hypothetical protein
MSKKIPDILVVDSGPEKDNPSLAVGKVASLVERVLDTPEGRMENTVVNVMKYVIWAAREQLEPDSSSTPLYDGDEKRLRVVAEGIDYELIRYGYGRKIRALMEEAIGDIHFTMADGRSDVFDEILMQEMDKDEDEDGFEPGEDELKQSVFFDKDFELKKNGLVEQVLEEVRVRALLEANINFDAYEERDVNDIAYNVTDSLRVLKNNLDFILHNLVLHVSLESVSLESRNAGDKFVSDLDLFMSAKSRGMDGILETKLEHWLRKRGFLAEPMVDSDDFVVPASCIVQEICNVHQQGNLSREERRGELSKLLRNFVVLKKIFERVNGGEVEELGEGPLTGDAKVYKFPGS